MPNLDFAIPETDMVIRQRALAGKNIQPARIAALVFTSLSYDWNWDHDQPTRSNITNAIRYLAVDRLHDLAVARVREYRRRNARALNQSAVLGKIAPRTTRPMSGCEVCEGSDAA